MKKFKFALFAFMVSMMAFTFASCSDDDEVKDVSVTGVTIAPQTLDLKEGTTGTLTALTRLTRYALPATGLKTGCSPIPTSMLIRWKV